MRKTVWLGALVLGGLIGTVTAGSAEAPHIADLKVDPSQGPVHTRYLLSLRVTDPQGPQDVRGMLFQLREGHEIIAVPINDAGREGDRRAGDGLYTGRTSVPSSAASGPHRFEVYVEDLRGQRSNGLAYEFTVRGGNFVQVRLGP